MSTSRSTSRVRVRYAETDQMGVVYYANYFVWFEVGRADLLRHAGWSYREMETDGIVLPVIEAHCAYRQSARYDDELEVRTSGALLSPIRLEFAYEVVRPSDAALIAEGRTMHASLDRDGRARRLPARIRDLFDAVGSGDMPDGDATNACQSEPAAGGRLDPDAPAPGPGRGEETGAPRDSKA